MNTMKITDFSPWWIRAALTRMANRKKHLKTDRIPLLSRRSIYTWVNCCNRGINKMKYRFRECQCSIAQIDEWETCINYQINKLHRRYDPVYLWGIAEYYNCEKVNIDGFSQDLFPCLIWKFKSIEQAVDMSKRLQSDTRLTRTERFTWGNLIGNVQKKYRAWKQSCNVSDEDDEFWNYCFRANRDKLLKTWGYVSWNSRIWQNKRKIERWHKVHNQFKNHANS